MAKDSKMEDRPSIKLRTTLSNVERVEDRRSQSSILHPLSSIPRSSMCLLFANRYLLPNAYCLLGFICGVDPDVIVA